MEDELDIRDLVELVSDETTNEQWSGYEEVANIPMRNVIRGLSLFS